MVTVGASSAAEQGCSLLQAWETPGLPSLPRPHLEEQLQAVGEGLAAKSQPPTGCNALLVVVVAQSCLTPCNPMDCSPPGVSQAGIWEKVALPTPGDLPDPGIKPMFPTLAADFFYH